MTKLPRRIGLGDATAILVGTVIGTGIFVVPGSIARDVPSTGAILALWTVTGLLTLCGALACAELGAMMPSTGGQYIYLREAYGPLCAFLCGWAFLLIVQSGTIAAKAAGFAIYLSYLAPVGPLWSRAAAIGMIVILTFINYRGVKLGTTVQNIFTVLKLAGLAAVIIAAFGGAASSHPDNAAAPMRWSNIGIATIACLYGYEGWNKITFIAGEILDPERNLKRTLVAGIGIVIGVYLLANLAYMRVLSLHEIAATERVSAVVAERAMGPAGATLVAITILLSIFGSNNGSMITSPRVYFAMAGDGVFFRIFATVHPRFQTPAFAIVLQGAWAIVLTLSGSFNTLISYLIFAAWIFYALTVAAVVILRRRRPEAPRPYRMWGYPWTPAAFVAASLWLVVNTIVTRPQPSLIGLGIIATGVPVYYLWRRAT